MHKISKWVIISTFLFPLLSLLLYFLFFPEYYESFTISAEIDIVFSILFAIITLFAIGLLARIYNQTRSIKPESIPILTLNLFIFFVIFTAITSVFTNIFVFTEPNLQLTWASTSSISLNAAVFFLFYLIIEFFMKGSAYKHNSQIINIGGIYTIVLNLLFEFGTIKPSNFWYILKFSGQLLLALVACFYLAWSGFSIREKVVERHLKKGFLFLGFAGTFLLIGFILNLLYSVSIVMDNILPDYFLWIMWCLWVIGIILTYFGFTIPMQKKETKIKENSNDH